MDEYQPQISDTMEDREEPNSSAVVLDALTQSEKAFRSYDDFCRLIDNVYSAKASIISNIGDIGFTDQEYDLFWSSIEILKPAIYAKPPRVVAKPRFSDANQTDKTAAEVLERNVNSEFERSDIDQVMLNVRDDLALSNRGVMWLLYETDDKGKKVCVEHLDRADFRHEPARKWSEVGWVARGAWMTRKQMADRFRSHSGQAYDRASFITRTSDRENGAADESLKALVWEVWSRADNKVYWVTEGVDVFLDEDKPHLNLKGFFPCPRPAYGTLMRRSLVPVPDYRRYIQHLDQINHLTRKIYDLLDNVRMMGLVAGGGDIATAIQTTLNSDDSMIVVPVPGAALIGNGGTAGLVQWLPLQEIAATIQGLIEARNQLFNDFYQLSGISDIMRGATESEETLGAQRLKSQYGSIRVKDKIDEMIRVARDAAAIATEIICDNFNKDDLLETAQMELPTKAEVNKALKELEKTAKDELKQLQDKAKQAADQARQTGQEINPQQAQQQFAQAQQQIVAKYAPQLQQLKNAVVIEDVMETIKDKKARSLIIDIETDSTVMVDEIAEKQSRSEFLQAFSNASASIQPLMMAGEAGAKLAGAMLKFALQPYNANRELDALIDEFIESAPEIAANMQGQEGEDAGLAEANNKLAEAEQIKAQAAMANVQARSMLDRAETQRKMIELQQKAQADQVKAQEAQAKLQLQLAELQDKSSKTQAEIDKIRADTAKILASIGLDVRKQELDEYRAATEQQDRQTDQALEAERTATDAQFRAEDNERANRQQDFSERSGERQITLAERQAEQQGRDNG